MASNITLKNKLLTDIVFVPRATAGNTVQYVAPGATLLGAMRCDLTIRDNGPTNRVIGKLSVPSVGINPATGVNGVQWNEVGSFDLSSVKSASSEAAEDFVTMFASFVASDAVKSMYVNGVRL